MRTSVQFIDVSVVSQCPCTSCRELGELAVLPQLVPLSTPARLWARLQAGRATAAELQNVCSLLKSAEHAIGDARNTKALEHLRRVRFAFAQLVW